MTAYNIEVYDGYSFLPEGLEPKLDGSGRIITEANHIIILRGQDLFGSLPIIGEDYSDVEMVFNEKQAIPLLQDRNLSNTYKFYQFIYVNPNDIINFTCTNLDNYFAYGSPDFPLELIDFLGVYDLWNAPFPSHNNPFSWSGLIHVPQGSYSFSLNLSPSLNNQFIPLWYANKSEYESNNIKHLLGAIIVGDGTVPNPQTTTTTTKDPNLTTTIAPQKPKKNKINYIDSYINLDNGQNINLKIDNKKYNLLHDKSVLLSNNQEFTSVVSINNTHINYDKIELIFNDILDLNGTISISIRIHEDNLLLATKNISKPTNKIIFNCSDLQNNHINLLNKILIITFKSICNPTSEDCCDNLESVKLFNQINDFCIYYPCNYTYPLNVYFTTAPNKIRRLILSDDYNIILDTGFINTNYNIKNYLFTKNNNLYFNNTGTDYLLDYIPLQIYYNDKNINSNDAEICDVEKSINLKSKTNSDDICNFSSIIPDSSTWILRYDICNMNVCVIEG